MNSAEPTCLLIADIAGYSTYLAGVELDHAQDILADLVGTVVTSLRPTFRLAKLEGDAAFMVAPAAKVDGSQLLDTIERCYFSFRRRRRDVRHATSCACDACVRIPDLNLKFVAHTGPVARQRMAGMEELVGRDVIVVHRLLKNRVSEATGATAYALLTDACAVAMGLRPADLGMARYSEAYDIGEVPGWVHDLERRWQEEDGRARTFVAPEDSMFGTTDDVPAPPATAWEYLTTPGRRVLWIAGVTDIIQDAPGNRRAVGTTNHCMHGKDAVVEEILDWRPFDYFTMRSTMQTPDGPLKLINTTELEPTPTGTKVSLRFAKPRSAKDLARLEPLTPMIEGLIVAGSAALRALMSSAAMDSANDGAPEPPLPSRRPESVLADLPPITIVG